MFAWLQSQGGPMALILVGIVVYNIVMSAIAQIFIALGKKEPPALQAASAWGLKIAQWFSANTPTPKP